MSCFTIFSNLISPKLITASVKGHVGGIWGREQLEPNGATGPTTEPQFLLQHSCETSDKNESDTRVLGPLKTLISKPKYKLSFVRVQSL